MYETRQADSFGHLTQTLLGVMQTSWNSGYPLMYYVLGGLVHVSFVRLCLVDFVVLLMGLQAPSVPSVLVLTSESRSTCSFSCLAACIAFQETPIPKVTFMK